MEPVVFTVKGTQARPSWLPLFVISHNNFNPWVVAEEAGLRVKVVTTTLLPRDRITAVREGTTLVGYSLVISSGGWDYLVHLRTREERDRLRETLQRRMQR